MIAWLRQFPARWRQVRALELERYTIAIMREALEAQQREARAAKAELRDAWAADDFYRSWMERLALPLPPTPLEIPGWLAVDQQALQVYFASQGGHRLFAAMRQMEADLFQAAVAADLPSADARERACGYAAGFRAAWAYLLTLSTALLPPDPQEPDSATATDTPAAVALRNRFRP